MIFNLIAEKDFTDKHDKSVKYKINDKIDVELERAVELLSNSNHLVRLESIENSNDNVLSDSQKEEVIKDFFESSDSDTIINYLTEDVINTIIETFKKNENSTEEGNLDPNFNNLSNDKEYVKELENKSFKELQEIAQAKNIDITGLTKKDKLITEILKK